MLRAVFRGCLPRRRGHWALLIVGLLIAVRLGVWLTTSSRGADFPPAGPYRVVRVVDGATLLLEGGLSVRLLGIEPVDDTHQSNPIGPQAEELLRRRAVAREVKLELDRERRDRHGDLLAYVFVDEALLNEELIRAGFSKNDPTANLDRTMATRFRRAETEARDAKRGMWQSATAAAR